MSTNTERLSEQVVIRVSVETKLKIEAIAEKKGMKHTALVRELVLESIEGYTATGGRRKSKAA